MEKVNNEIFSNLSKDLNLVVLELLNAIIIDIGENNVKYLAQVSFFTKQSQNKTSKQTVADAGEKNVF